MRWFEVVSCLVLLILARVTPALAQTKDWTIRAGLAYARPSGAFEAERANGKVVSSDVDGGVSYSIRVERRLTPRFGVTVGGMRSEHDFIIHQDFPDGSEFEARDGFAFEAVTAGVAIHLMHDGPVELVVEPFVLFARYDDVSLGSAGPPYDRTYPIDVDVESTPGVGVIAGVDIPAGGERVSINPWIGVTAIRFSGPFQDDPSIPGSGGEIGVAFSPLLAGIAIAIRF